MNWCLVVGWVVFMREGDGEVCGCWSGGVLSGWWGSGVLGRW